MPIQATYREDARNQARNANGLENRGQRVTAVRGTFRQDPSQDHSPTRSGDRHRFLDCGAVNVRTITHGRYRTNTYIADDGVSGNALLIDPTENPDGCIEVATSAGLQITAIVATHSHFDHIGGVAGVAKQLRVPFLIGRHALDSLHREPQRARETGVEIADPPEPDRLLDDGDWIEIGGLRFQTLYTPGHWQGDICLHEPIAKVVFTGDCLHHGKIGRYNEGCNEEELLRSIKAKLLPLPDETVVYSGHGAVTTIGEERVNNRDLLGLPRLPE